LGSRSAISISDPRNRGYFGIYFPAYPYLFNLATIAEVQAHRIRILAVDHNPLLREGLRLLIQLQPDMELVAVAASGQEAVQTFRQHRPDVTLMDLDLPHAEGLTTLREILKIDPATCVIGLLTYQEDESGAHALRAGAKSCVTKDRLNQDLVSLIRDHARHDD
jgi:DNA-binding NarL/FixJ family response regulator